MVKRPKLSREAILRNSVAQHVKDAGRKAQKGCEPNDRKYDSDFQRSIRRMSADQLDDMLNGEE
jgi:hypothetical protein